MPLRINSGGVIRAGPYLDSIREKATTASAENKPVAIIILGRSVTLKLDRNKASRTVFPPCMCAIIISAAAPAKKIVCLSPGIVRAI